MLVSSVQAALWHLQLWCHHILEYHNLDPEITDLSILRTSSLVLLGTCVNKRAIWGVYFYLNMQYISCVGEYIIQMCSGIMFLLLASIGGREEKEERSLSLEDRRGR